MDHIEDVNVLSHERLISPERLKAALPAGDEHRRRVQGYRQSIADVLAGRDSRLLVITGPCSIHDVDAALDYGRRLKAVADQLSEQLLIVMRVYFEKPRTTTGWKGLINDPYLDDSFQIEHGLHAARQLLLDLTDIGLPLATEALDPIAPQYLQDLISWSAIGARTAESQTHREMASGLSCPVGFKNGTDGSLEVAINALKSAASAHRFLGLSASGEVAVFHTRGNNNAHIVLRGSTKGPNYTREEIARSEQELRAAGATPRLLVDCSHANSSKDHTRQPLVARDVLAQIQAGNESIFGIMLESNLQAGRQDLNGEPLEYGVSVTDACIGWAETETLLAELSSSLTDKRLNDVA